MKTGDNAFCPCGSGLKYKKCCKTSGDSSDLLARTKAHLQEKLAQPQQYDEATRQKMIQAMRDNNADPAYIHAFEQTGILVFQETMHLIPEEDMQRWSEAYEDYGKSFSSN